MKHRLSCESSAQTSNKSFYKPTVDLSVCASSRSHTTPCADTGPSTQSSFQEESVPLQRMSPAGPRDVRTRSATEWPLDTLSAPDVSKMAVQTQPPLTLPSSLHLKSRLLLPPRSALHPQSLPVPRAQLLLLQGTTLSTALAMDASTAAHSTTSSDATTTTSRAGELLLACD